jgi:hypothetical protein
MPPETQIKKKIKLSENVGYYYDNGYDPHKKEMGYPLERLSIKMGNGDEITLYLIEGNLTVQSSTRRLYVSYLDRGGAALGTEAYGEPHLVTMPTEVAREHQSYPFRIVND